MRVRQGSPASGGPPPLPPPAPPPPASRPSLAPPADPPPPAEPSPPTDAPSTASPPCGPDGRSSGGLAHAPHRSSATRAAMKSGVRVGKRGIGAILDQRQARFPQTRQRCHCRATPGSPNLQRSAQVTRRCTTMSNWRSSAVAPSARVTACALRTASHRWLPSEICRSASYAAMPTAVDRLSDLRSGSMGMARGNPDPPWRISAGSPDGSEPNTR